jgi:hypothetical protein
VARYARSGDLHIAYAVRGDGPLDIVWIPPWISQVEYLWAEPSLERFADRVIQFARLITFDRRGSGLSDPFLGAPTLEELSGTVKDLVVWSGIEFEDRGERELRGVPGEWRLYAVG